MHQNHQCTSHVVEYDGQNHEKNERNGREKTENETKKKTIEEANTLNNNKRKIYIEKEIKMCLHCTHYQIYNVQRGANRDPNPCTDSPNERKRECEAIKNHKTHSSDKKPISNVNYYTKKTRERERERVEEKDTKIVCKKAPQNKRDELHSLARGKTDKPNEDET